MKSIWYLEDIELFKLLCPHKYSEFLRKNGYDIYNKNDYIYFEEDCSNKIFLIDQGKVKLGYHTYDGEEIIKGILSRGEIFGERSVLDSERRDEFAQCTANRTIVCKVPADTIQELIKDNKTFSIKFYKFLGYRFKKLERRIKLLLFKDVKTRLLEFFSELKEEFGDSCEIETKDVIITHPYTQKDIASLIGTSRPTLNAMMNELKESDVIDFNRKEVRLKKDIKKIILNP